MPTTFTFDDAAPVDITGCRTSAAEVAKVIEVEEGVSLSPFIYAANSLVTELCTDSGYADARLAMIETWLAAHFYAIRDPRMSSEGFGGASGSFQGQTAMNLSATTYGQQAMLLDTAGALAVLNAHTVQGKRARVGVVWLGKDPEEGE